jgi:predicted enzyme related to lactoylglutathione lyase
VTQASLFILYVQDVSTSVAFYGQLLQQKPLEASPTFAMFALTSGVNLSLWSRDCVLPPPPATTGGSEVVFGTENVDGVHEQWREHGVRIAQPPTEMDFGRTFVALDPDGHRLRVFAPTAV